MIELVVFKSEHLQGFQPRQVYLGEQPANLDVLDLGPNAMTIMAGGKPIAIFGGWPVLLGVFHVWALTTGLVKNHPVGFHKKVKFLIDFWFEKANLHRMQMTVRVGFTEGFEWAKSLGFQCEGVLRKYSQDKADYWMFARVA